MIHQTRAQIVDPVDSAAQVWYNMSRLDRKIRRKAAKEKKKLAEKEMATKIALFDQIPYVIVRNEQEKVNLYCPPCWNKALNTIKELEQHTKKEK